MTSTKTGIALYKSIGLIVVGNPAATVITSSPGLMALEPSLGEVRLEKAIKLAEDPELMQLMVDSNLRAVFLGIETPDEDSLELTHKYQNNRNPLNEAVEKIIKSGIRVMAGFIIGFDGEKPGAGDRIVKFVEETTIPTAMFSMLQVMCGIVHIVYRVYFLQTL